MQLSAFIGIDYSGAKTAASRLKGLQVYEAKPGQAATIVRSPSAPKGKNWNWKRIEIAEWLASRLHKGDQFIVGIDHAFSFPATYMARNGLISWDAFLDDFISHWPLHEPHSFVDHLRPGNQRTGDPKELRLTEQWTSSAKSVFRFDVQGQVAKSTHTGIPWLKHIREQAGEMVHFWPFDGWNVPDGKSIIAEVYPSIFRNRFPRDDRTIDQQDAYAISRWLTETTAAGNLPLYFEPPLTKDEKAVAELEGWILGIF